MIKRIFTKKPYEARKHCIEYWATVSDEYGLGDQMLYRVYNVDGGYVATRGVSDIPSFCRKDFDELELLIYEKHNMAHMLKRKNE
jgi:hypothetical protein